MRTALNTFNAGFGNRVSGAVYTAWLDGEIAKDTPSVNQAVHADA
jgi:hypothetical protein